ncbi:hypothetical protein [Deinococcus aquatilis]|uniref:hypothetical protein n=1 Tax=Deinococcus aquatilis TaxID=519440 RepID=UPI00036DCEB5|nr:hypothetical protein [Deinococcus aquatilis]
MSLPEHRRVPTGLAHRSGLKKQGLVPTADPVAIYVFRHQNGLGHCELFDLKQTRPLKEALAARTRRLVDLNGQPSLF